MTQQWLARFSHRMGDRRVWAGFFEGARAQRVNERANVAGQARNKRRHPFQNARFRLSLDFSDTSTWTVETARFRNSFVLN